MSRKLGFWLLWVSLAVYAFFLAPPNQPDTLELIKNLSTGKWEGINPLIVSLFNIMGIWPMIYSCLVFIDGREQKNPSMAICHRVVWRGSVCLVALFSATGTQSKVYWL